MRLDLAFAEGKQKKKNRVLDTRRRETVVSGIRGGGKKVAGRSAAAEKEVSLSRWRVVLKLHLVPRSSDGCWSGETLKVRACSQGREMITEMSQGGGSRREKKRRDMMRTSRRWHNEGRTIKRK